MLPEFKSPKKKAAKAAVAEAAVAEGAPAMAPEWIWNEGGEDTMHPFWGVRRMTAKQLARAKLDVKPGKMAPRFNCELTLHTMSLVCVSSMKGPALNRTRIFQLPFMTNCKEILKDEELIFEIAEAKKTKPAGKDKRSWRDVMRDEDKEVKKQEAKSAKSAKVQEF